MTPRKNTQRLLITALGLMAIMGGFLAWQLAGPSAKPSHHQDHTAAVQVAHAKPKGSEQLYTCGMHPNVIQQGPGTCPICGMDLTPMKKGSPLKSSEQTSEGAITVDPVMVQNMGVRVAHAKRRGLSKRVRTIGEVVVAEDLVSVVNLKFSGWIERLHVDRTGTKVRRGQALFSVYSPELVLAQEEYLLALRSAGKESPLARSAKRRLAFWDLGPATLSRIERRGKALRSLTITAPRSGYVLHKNVVQGAKVNAGQDLFRIGRLDAIWVHAQVYEFDAPWVRVGQKATMELSFEKGRQYSGKVSYIYPTLSTKSRTLRVRLEFVNPNLQLKPGMFTTVWIETQQRSDVLAIPTEAIIHSGERNLVFVTTQVGKYAPRQVVTGLSGDGHITEIKSGLKEGEVVVISGQFLLDSESQLQEALQKLLASRLQAKRGKTPEHGAHDHTAHQHQHAAQEIWTCPMHPRIAEEKAGSCPICGMDLVLKKTDKKADRPICGMDLVLKKTDKKADHANEPPHEKGAR
ncbi:MAG: efflux RND transporter periplasmic adaptor subunit [Deltaproteobacteria bacterium]|nr:efflux RND transporter periplasmic adaptor subunit [Deltaproteobacteria bacterium]